MDWLKELLKAAGIDETKIDGVMAEFNKEVPKHLIPKEKYNEVAEAKKQLETDLATRDTQLEELSKTAGASKELQAEIAKLQSENTSAKEQYENQIKQIQIDNAVERALIDAKAKNPKAVKALLNTEAIKLDGEKLLGLDEQLKPLAESDGYLFAQDSEGKPTFKGFTPIDGEPPTGTEPKAGDYGKQMAESLAKSNEGLEDARKSYFE